MARLRPPHRRHCLQLLLWLLVVGATAGQQLHPQTPAAGKTGESPSLQAFFDILDDNRDGQLQQQELRAAAVSLGSPDAAAAANKMQHRLDSSDLGMEISFAELDQHLHQVLKGVKVSEWISHGLGLPRYADTFAQNAVTPLDFPLLVSDDGKLLETELQVIRPLHRQQILRAMQRQMLGLGSVPGNIDQLQCTTSSSRGGSSTAAGSAGAAGAAGAAARVVTCSWLAPTSLGDPPLHKYILQRFSLATPGASWQVVAELHDSSRFADVPGQPGHYQYRLAAWNIYGRSPYCLSEEVEVVGAAHAGDAAAATAAGSAQQGAVSAAAAEDASANQQAGAQHSRQDDAQGMQLRQGSMAVARQQQAHPKQQHQVLQHAAAAVVQAHMQQQQQQQEAASGRPLDGLVRHVPSSGAASNGNAGTCDCHNHYVQQHDQQSSAGPRALAVSLGSGSRRDSSNVFVINVDPSWQQQDEAQANPAAVAATAAAAAAASQAAVSANLGSTGSSSGGSPAAAAGLDAESRTGATAGLAAFASRAWQGSLGKCLRAALNSLLLLVLPVCVRLLPVPVLNRLAAGLARLLQLLPLQWQQALLLHVRHQPSSSISMVESRHLLAAAGASNGSSMRGSSNNGSGASCHIAGAGSGGSSGILQQQAAATGVPWDQQLEQLQAAATAEALPAGASPAAASAGGPSWAAAPQHSGRLPHSCSELTLASLAAQLGVGVASGALAADACDSGRLKASSSSSELPSLLQKQQLVSAEAALAGRLWLASNSGFLQLGSMTEGADAGLSGQQGALSSMQMVAVMEQEQKGAGSKKRCAFPSCQQQFDMRHLKALMHRHYCGRCQQAFCLQHTAYSPHGAAGSCGAESRCICCSCIFEFTPQYRMFLESRNTLPCKKDGMKRSAKSSPLLAAAGGGPGSSSSSGLPAPGSASDSRPSSPSLPSLAAAAAGPGGSVQQQQQHDAHEGSSRSSGLPGFTADDLANSSYNPHMKNQMLWNRARTKASAVVRFKAAGLGGSGGKADRGGAEQGAAAAGQE